MKTVTIHGIDSLIERMHFSAEIRKSMSSYIRCSFNHVSELAAHAFDGTGMDLNICSYKAIDRLAALIFKLPDLYDKYLTACTPEDIIYDTFDDIALRAGIYYEENGELGLSAEDSLWFRHINNVDIFKIGSIQFQLFEMVYLDKETLGESYMVFPETLKALLPKGSPVINCHIQANADLTPGAVDKSFSKAEEFFSRIYPTYEIFICYSWLLYPPMMEIFDMNSNIRHFTQQFNIVSAIPDNEQALENIRANSWLRNIASQMPSKFGYGCGIRTAPFC